MSLPQLAKLARELGGGQPILLLDLAALDANTKVVVDFARANRWAVRPALKSFRSPRLIAYLLQRLPEPRGLVFNLPEVDADPRTLSRRDRPHDRIPADRRRTRGLPVPSGASQAEAPHAALPRRLGPADGAPRQARPHDPAPAAAGRGDRVRRRDGQGRDQRPRGARRVPEDPPRGAVAAAPRRRPRLRRPCDSQRRRPVPAAGRGPGAGLLPQPSRLARRARRRPVRREDADPQRPGLVQLPQLDRRARQRDRLRVGVPLRGLPERRVTTCRASSRR